MCVHILFIHCIIYNNTYIFHHMGIHNYTFREMFPYMRVAESWIRSRCTSKAGGFPGNSRPTSRGRLQPSRWLWVEPQLGLGDNTGSAFTQFCWIFSFIKVESWAFVPKYEPAANGKSFLSHGSPVLLLSRACRSAVKVQECTRDNSSATYTPSVQSDHPQQAALVLAFVLPNGLQVLSDDCWGTSLPFVGNRQTKLLSFLSQILFQINQLSSVNDLVQRHQLHLIHCCDAQGLNWQMGNENYSSFWSPTQYQESLTLWQASPICSRVRSLLRSTLSFSLHR